MGKPKVRLSKAPQQFKSPPPNTRCRTSEPTASPSKTRYW